MKMFERQERERHSDPDSDLDLHRAAGRGSEEAMAALYRRHGALIYRFSLRLSQDPSIAEEVTQDVFLAFCGSRTASIQAAPRSRRGCAVSLAG
jgi:DNA-directed RNA polymerase specialized sigma24 family protein